MYSTHTVCSESGHVYAFGSNKKGELGLVHPTPLTVTTPTKVTPLKDIIRVACGRLHSAAIDGMLITVNYSLDCRSCLISGGGGAGGNLY